MTLRSATPPGCGRRVRSPSSWWCSPCPAAAVTSTTTFLRSGWCRRRTSPARAAAPAGCGPRPYGEWDTTGYASTEYGSYGGEHQGVPPQYSPGAYEQQPYQADPYQGAQYDPYGYGNTAPYDPTYTQGYAAPYDPAHGTDSERPDGSQQ